MATGSTARKQSKQGRSASTLETFCEPAELALPPSSIDQDDYPSGPNGMARFLEDRIEELERQKCEAPNRAHRRPINKQLHLCRDLLRWCKSRAG